MHALLLLVIEKCVGTKYKQENRWSGDPAINCVYIKRKRARERARGNECCNIELYLLIYRLYSYLNFPVKQIILCVRISVIYETIPSLGSTPKSVDNVQVLICLRLRKKNTDIVFKFGDFPYEMHCTYSVPKCEITAIQ